MICREQALKVRHSWLKPFFNKKLPSYKSIKKLVIRETEFVKTTTQKIKRFAEEEKKERQEEQEKNEKNG